MPRIGLTRVINRFHAKLLYSEAYKTPVIENINLNREIKPERTKVIELEAGYQLSSIMLLTANFYDITIKKPIIYFCTGLPSGATFNLMLAQSGMKVCTSK